MNASQPEPELEVEGPAANLTPNKQNPGLGQWFMVTHNACLSSVSSLLLPPQVPVTAMEMQQRPIPHAWHRLGA